MIFPLMFNLFVVQKSEQVSSDNKSLSSLIEKAWCTCTFINHFMEVNEQ